MKHPFAVGFNFGLTSGIITTLGLLVGLNSGTHSKIVVLSGVVTIAIADALSDAVGIHISEESERVHSSKEIWQATISTFIFKFLAAVSFIAPVLLFNLDTAILVSVGWSLLTLGILSYFIAREEGKKPWKVVSEHILIAVLVIIATYYAGSAFNL